jgi:hypothetical protein
MRWIVGIVLFFLTIFVANGMLVYSALSHDDPIVQSYIEDPR